MIISQFTLEELAEKICERLKPQLQSHASAPHAEPEEFLTSKQSAKLLGVSLPTLHKWKIEGRVKFYRIATRIRFKRSDLLKALQCTSKGKGKAE